IVVRVAAFKRVGEQDAEITCLHGLDQASCQLDQPARGLLVRDAECDERLARYSCDGERVLQFSETGVRIVHSRREASSVGVLQIPGCAVRHQYEGGTRPAGKLGTAANGFIIRM